MLTLFAPRFRLAFARHKTPFSHTPERLIATLCLCLCGGLGSQTVWAGALAIPHAAPQAIDRQPFIKPLTTGIDAASSPQSSLTINTANKPAPLSLAAWVLKQQAVCDPTNRLVLDLERTAAASNTNTATSKLSKPAPPNPKAINLQSQQAYASWLMGLLALHGICMPLNTAQAASWFLRASDLGEPLANAGMA